MAELTEQQRTARSFVERARRRLRFAELQLAGARGELERETRAAVDTGVPAATVAGWVAGGRRGLQDVALDRMDNLDTAPLPDTTETHDA